MPDPLRRVYWRHTLILTAALLGLWLAATFVPAYWARELNRLRLFGWPFGFYMAAQGSLLIYLAIVWIYARVMDRFDRRYGVDEDAAPPAGIRPRDWDGDG